MKHEFRHWFTNAVIHVEDVPDDSSNPTRAALERFAMRGMAADDLRALRERTVDGVDDEDVDDVERAMLNQRIEAIDGELASPSDHASLDGASLVGASLVGARLVGASLVGASLVGASLDRASLDGASLVGASLVGASLVGASLVGARGLPPGFVVPPDTKESRAARSAAYRARHPDVPVVDGLDARILEEIKARRLKLDMGSWHGVYAHGSSVVDACGTTHCRAGSAIHLAGPAGYALERRLGSAAAAGTMIYLASTGRVPYFYGDTDAALEDIRACAEADREVESADKASP